MYTDRPSSSNGSESLQVFSGQFQGAVSGDSQPDVTNLITDYWAAGTPMAGKPFHNIYYDGQRYNMGGCMGCHGNAAVNNGSDFSFILQGGRVGEAEAAPNRAPAGGLRLHLASRSLAGTCTGLIRC